METKLAASAVASQPIERTQDTGLAITNAV
jgi:hypothetical protein